MHWYTHMMISDIIHTEVIRRYDIILDSKALKLGSIVPDFWPKYMKLKHKKEMAMCEVGEMINKLKSQSVPEDKGKLFNYSMKVGVVMHYITDFFCYAHNHPMFEKSIEHLKYELAISREFKRANIEEILRGVFRKSRKNSNRKNIEEYIEKKHDEYIYTPPGMEKDIDYSLKMCVSVVFSILEGI